MLEIFAPIKSSTAYMYCLAFSGNESMFFIPFVEDFQPSNILYIGLPGNREDLILAVMTQLIIILESIQQQQDDILTHHKTYLSYQSSS